MLSGLWLVMYKCIQVTQINLVGSDSITVSPRSHGSRSSGASGSGSDSRGGDDTSKRRRVSPARHSAESSSGDETLSALPCLVALNPGVRIASVAAGGRHTLALSGRQFVALFNCRCSVSSRAELLSYILFSSKLQM